MFEVVYLNDRKFLNVCVVILNFFYIINILEFVF